MSRKPSKAIQARREQKRLEILKAAAAIFNERGFHNTTIDDLCERLGLSKPTVYYYVKDKEALLVECAKLATHELHAAIRLARDEGTNGWERLRNIFVAYAQVMTTDFGKCLILTSQNDMSADSAERLWEGRRRLNLEIREVIETGIRDGSIEDCDPKIVSFALFGAFNWIAHWFQEDGDLPAAQIAGVFVRLFQTGMAAGAARDDRAPGGLRPPPS